MKTLEFDELLCINGVRYEKKNKQLYSGKALEKNVYGKTLQSAIYLNGIKNGKTVRFYGNGKKWCEIEFKDGKFDGKYTEWYSNGKIMLVKFFENGQPIGKEIKHSYNVGKTNINALEMV
jgi:antitoxin component YwqK of YwqJK toxin-antitoxin module